MVIRPAENQLLSKSRGSEYSIIRCGTCVGDGCDSCFSETNETLKEILPVK